MSTQQQEDGGEGADLYLELEKAITERKCRILQKKQKLRLIINNTKKQKGESRSARNGKKCLMKECEEIFNQKNSRVQNIKKSKESRETLETSLCDLNNKLSFEKAETKKKREEYDAAIKNAQKTWESYKEKYENFPLARKVQVVKIEFKKIKIEIKQAIMDVADLKAKRQLKYQIAERRFQLNVVKLAEKYFMYQKKVEEREDILQKIIEMKKKVADLKCGKMTKQQLESSKVSTGPGTSKEHHVIGIPEPLLFASLEVQMTSHPSTDNEDECLTGRKKLFDWGSLLGSSSLLSFSKKSAENEMKPMLNSSVSNQKSASSDSDLQPESQKNTFRSGNSTGTSMKLTNLLRNITATKKKPDMNVGRKRINEEENKPSTNTVKMLQSKKVCKSLPQSTTSLTTLNNSVLKESPPQIVVKKDQADTNLLNKENKENINSKNSSSLTGVQYRSQLVENNQNKPTTPIMSRGVSQNVMNILSMKNTGNVRKPESLQKDIHEQVNMVINKAANNTKILQNDQQKHYNEGDLYRSNNTGRQNQQFEEMPVLLEPGSPAPDLIPVETNTLPLSQADLNMSQIYGSPGQLVLSGESDFISPNSADLDEATRLVYQRIAAEAQIGPDCTKGPMNAISNQKSVPENNTVRSQYFSNFSPEPQSLNTPPDPQGGDYQPLISQPYSPIVDTRFDNKTQSMDIHSPPPASTDTFGGSVPVTNSSVGSVPAPNPSAFSFERSNFKTKTSVFDFF